MTCIILVNLLVPRKSNANLTQFFCVAKMVSVFERKTYLRVIQERLGISKRFWCNAFST